jgi:GAF domain-containing protein/HAMP domain-containing protein
MTKSEKLSPAQSRQARRAQQLAILILFLALISIFLPLVLSQWQFSWQTIALLLGEAIIITAMLLAIYQLRAGRLARAGWIMVGALLVAPLIISLAIAGIGLALGVVVIVVIIIIADLTLPPAIQGRAIGLGVGSVILGIILDAINVFGRITIPVLNTLLPIIALVFLGILGVSIVQRFSNFTLRTKLIVVSLTVSLIPLGLIGLVFAFNAQQNAVATANQTLQTAAQETSNNLDAFIQTNLNDVRVASQIPELVDILQTTDRDSAAYTAAEARAAGILRSLRRRDPIFLRSYALLDKDGNNLLDTSRASMGSNEAISSYFAGPISTGLPYVSPVTLDPGTGRPSLYFSAPVRDSSGTFRGVLRARYDAAVLQEQIYNSDGLAGSTSGASLLDENNIKLADGLQPDALFKIMGRPTPEQIDLLKAQQRLPDLPAEDLVISSLVPVGGPTNTAQQPTFQAVHTLNSQPWTVTFSSAESEFLAPLNQQNRLLLLSGLLSALLVAGVAVFAAQAISRPVSALTETAEKISQGDLTAQAQVTTQDEIGTLARTFNSMTDQLRGMVVTLEDRVQARTDQLRASAEVGRAATSILNSDQLLEQVASLITARFGFYYAAVFTLDEQGQRASLRAATGEAGRILLERHHSLPVTSESMVGAAIIMRRARIAQDVGQDAVRFANPLLPTTRSEIALPLRVSDRVLGALDVQSEQAGTFDEASAEVLQAMADQIAVALFNAETFDHSEKQARILVRLNQLSRDLAQATTRESVAFAVAQAVTDLNGPSHMALIELTANPQLLAARTLSTNASQPLSDPQPVPVNKSFNGECLKRGALVYLPDLSTVVDKYDDAAMIYALGVRASVALPLRIGEHVIGTLNVGSDWVNAYPLEQLSQLEQVAAQVALALDSLNLAKQTQQALAELDAANRRLVGQAWSTYTQTGGLVAAEWRTGQWNTTRQQGPRAEVAPSQALVPSAQAINLPIKVRGSTIGEFSVAPDTGQADWNLEEVAFAQALIDQVGQVLENARLLEETERSARREKAVADAADKIHRSTDIETVLHSAIAELKRITGRRGISVQLGFGPAETLRQTDGQVQRADAEGDR